MDKSVYGVRGRVGGVQRFSTEDGPGLRTTVFVAGCPLNCQWCHNPELIDGGQQMMFTPSLCLGCGACDRACPQGAVSRGQIQRELCRACGSCAEVCYAQALRPVLRELDVEQVMDAVRRDRGYYQQTGGGLTISGGELLSQPAFSRALLTAAEQEGVPVALDTSGWGDGPLLLDLALPAQYVLFDIKLADPRRHRQYTGRDNGLILANLELLAGERELREKIIIRLPLLAGVNDGAEDIRDAGRLMQSLGLTRATLLPYHSLGRAKARGLGRSQPEFASPDPSRLEQIGQELAGFGVAAQRQV